MEIITDDMSDKTYTGNLIYDGEEYQFVFFDNNLRLIPVSKEKYSSVLHMGMKKLPSGAFTIGSPPRVKENFIIGHCYENYQKIIFLPKKGSYISQKNIVIFVEVDAYIVFKSDIEAIDKISFSSPEINCIYPANQAISYTIDIDKTPKNGTLELHTNSFDQTTTAEQLFSIDGKNIAVSFGISRAISTRIWEPPITTWTNLVFIFEATNDYRFILDLCRLAKQFIQFLCYRRNIKFTKIELSSPAEKGMHETIADLNIISAGTEDTDLETLKEGRYIKQRYIAGHEGQILSQIYNNNLYLRNLPESYSSGQCINAARFIMITTAFEWEFDKLYPNGIARSQARIDAEETVSAELNRLIKNSSGKIKRIYNDLLKMSKRSLTLANKIKKVGEDFGNLINPFGERLYRMNDEQLNYSQMGERIANQRNHFAHGDLDKDFIGLSLLDLIFLERIIYAMQLKSVGLEDKQIQKAINNLFNCNLAIK